MNKSYIIYDEKGDPVNGKYPPNKKMYGEEFGAYNSEAEKILFHDFAAMSMVVSFMYNGAKYYFYVIGHQ